MLLNSLFVICHVIFFSRSKQTNKTGIVNYQIYRNLYLTSIYFKALCIKAGF